MLRRVLDVLTDCAVVSFAFWTLLYCLGLATQWSLWPSGWLWLVATVVFTGWRLLVAVRDVRAGSPLTPSPGAPAAGVPTVSATVLRALLVGGLVATAVAAVGGLVWTRGTFPMTWLATVVALAALLGWAWLSGRAGPAPAAGPPSPSRAADLGVLLLMLGCAVVSLFVHLADTDDPYYLNRSVWVAEHGNAALQDTMFSPEALNSPYGGGIPIASIEALIGVLAHMTGVRAGAMTYLVTTPVATVLAVWALWRLARAWAPRRAFLVLLAGVAFLMLSGESMLGNFWVVRIWQGKVIAVVMLMPLIWAYLTEVVEATSFAERRRHLLLLLAAGIAFFGLTPTAVVWAPLMFGAVVVAAVLVRSRHLVVGGALMVLGPVVSGLVVVLFSSDVGGPDPVALPSWESFVRILGVVGPMVALALVALCLAPVLARSGAAAALAGTAAFTSVVVFAPGVLPLINTVTGSGPILWRMLYVAPIPILVGLLAALPWPSRAVEPSGTFSTERLVGLAGVAGTLVLVAGLVLGGRPIWTHTGHGGPVTVSSSPQWKLDLAALRDVRLLDERGIDGVVLLPPRWMKVLTMYTTDAFPVVPRHWFIRNMEEPVKNHRARDLLHDLAAAKPPLPSQQEVDKALERLEVDLACTSVSPYRERVLELYAGSGYGHEEQIGSLTCLSTEGSR